MLARKSFLLSTLLVGSLGAGVGIAVANAQDVIKQNPASIGSGLNPQGGQINPGVGVQAPAGSPPGMNDQSGSGTKVGDRAAPISKTAATGEPIPSPEEARAAFHQSLFKDALAGEAPVQSAAATNAGDAQKVTGRGSADPTGASAGHAAIGGALSPGASASGSGGSSGGGSDSSAATKDGAGAAQQTTAPAPAAKPQANGGDEPRLGPIGALGQTMPAKFSKRNNTLDRLPTMAWPLPLTDEERHQVYRAVIAEPGPISNIDKLQVTDELPPQLALTAMQPLPQAVAGLNDMTKLQYVKSKEKILLVTPATRVIVDVITD